MLMNSFYLLNLEFFILNYIIRKENSKDNKIFIINMIFYYKPSFKWNYPNYSLFSSLLFIIVGMYLMITEQGPSTIQYMTLIVGLISVIHHCRTNDENFHDIFRMIDIFCANLLGLLVFYYKPTYDTLYFGIFILFIFILIQKLNCNRNKSFFHALFHISICIFILYSFKK